MKPSQITALMITTSTALSAFATTLLAEEGGAPVYELDQYVVVSTRTPLSMDRVSPSVSYISDQEISFWQDHSLVDVLNDEPGMTLITAGATGAQTSLFTRGTESNHTALFYDGRRLNTGFGNQFDLESLSVGNLSSVQVQRGASSVQYGSSGIGGVVDLRTKSGMEEPGASGSASLEIGSNDYIRGDLEYAYSNENLGLSFSASEMSTDNERDNDAYDKTAFMPRIDYKLSDVFYLELVGQYIEAEKELPGSTAWPSSDRYQTTENWLISPGVKYLTDQLSVHLFYSRSSSELEDHQFGSSDILEVTADEVNLQVDYSVNDDTLLSLGAVYREDQAYDSDTAFSGPPVPYEEGFYQKGIYAQLINRLSERIELRAGLRFDDYSDYDSKTTGNIEAIYNIKEWDASIFAKLATSYAPPSAQDIAFDGDPVGTPLQAEESTSYEFGFRQKAFDEKVEWSLVYFHNDIDELLDFVFVPPFTFDSINVKEAKTEGVEFQVNYKPTDRLQASLGYTYLTADDESNEVRLLRRPRHTLKLSTSYQFTDSFRAGIEGVGYYDREDLQVSSPYGRVDHEDQFVVRLVGDWEINDQWSVFARVENLFDEAYAPTIGFPALGRSGYIGAKFSF